MDSKKYIGMDVHKEAISVAVLNALGNRRLSPVSSRLHSKLRPAWRTDGVSHWRSLRQLCRCTDQTYIPESRTFRPVAYGPASWSRSPLT